MADDERTPRKAARAPKKAPAKKAAPAPKKTAGTKKAASAEGVGPAAAGRAPAAARKTPAAKKATTRAAPPRRRTPAFEDAAPDVVETAPVEEAPRARQAAPSPADRLSKLRATFREAAAQAAAAEGGGAAREAPPRPRPFVREEPEPEPEREPEPEPEPRPEPRTRPFARRGGVPEPLDVPVPEDEEDEDTGAEEHTPAFGTAVAAPPPASSPPPPHAATVPAYTAPAAPTPPTPRRERSGRGVGTFLVIALIVLAVIVGGVVVIGHLTKGGGVKYSELVAGDCTKKPSGHFNRVKTVPCAQEHDLEVYAVLQHPAPAKTAFPGMDALERYAIPLCMSQFQAYAGVPFEQLNLRDAYITPRESAWNSGARTIVCAVEAGNEQPTKGSIKAGAH